jgi:hypothetical protein
MSYHVIEIVTALGDHTDCKLIGHKAIVERMNNYKPDVSQSQIDECHSDECSGSILTTINSITYIPIPKVLEGDNFEENPYDRRDFPIDYTMGIVIRTVFVPIE